MDLNTGSDELSVVGDTAVDAPDPARLDITVTVTWQVTRNSVCAFRGPGANRPASTVTYTRTLRTQI